MKTLVPYVTGGVTDDWTALLLACQEGGADAIEVGLPFSDPMLDGPTIQQASDRALARGVTVGSLLAELAGIRARVRVPLIAFTYANLVFRQGAADFCERLAAAGVTGLIVPDLPFDEAAPVRAAAADAGIDLILLAAPVTSDERLADIAAGTSRFIYAISRMGTTGERAELDESAAALVARLRAITDRPVLLGFGIDGPEQAEAAGRAGDGVVIGSALMRRVLDGATPDDLRREVGVLRAALDRAGEGADPT